MDEKEYDKEMKERYRGAASLIGGLGVEDLAITGCQCAICKHYLGDNKCKAFPDWIAPGIPEELFTHDHIHPDQEGNYLFEPIKSP